MENLLILLISQTFSKLKTKKSMIVSANIIYLGKLVCFHKFINYSICLWHRLYRMLI